MVVSSKIVGSRSTFSWSMLIIFSNCFSPIYRRIYTSLKSILLPYVDWTLNANASFLFTSWPRFLSASFTSFGFKHCDFILGLFFLRVLLMLIARLYITSAYLSWYIFRSDDSCCLRLEYSILLDTLKRLLWAVPWSRILGSSS